VEKRAIYPFPTDGMAMNFPYARSVVVVRSSRLVKKTAQESQETRYYVSSLDPKERTPSQWQHLIRGHWGGSEIRNHWRRDALLGEDRSRSRKPSLLANLALIRTCLLRILPTCFPGEPLPVVQERAQKDSNLAFRILSA